MKLIPHCLTPVDHVDGIRSLIGIGTFVSALTHSVLYPHDTSTRLALKLFRREPDIAEFDWPFTPIHSSSEHFSTCPGSDLHPDTIGASSWPWIDHSVSGLPRVTQRPVKTRFRSGFVHWIELNLATQEQLAGSLCKRHAVPRQVGVRPLVNIRFQVLFHSPSGVLFTFPSRY